MVSSMSPTVATKRPTTSKVKTPSSPVVGTTKQKESAQTSSAGPAMSAAVAIKKQPPSAKKP